VGDRKGPRSPAALEAAHARKERETARRRVFGNLLRAAMAKKAMSQSDLAREASKFLPVPKRHKRGAEGSPNRGYKIGRDSISVYCRGEGFPTAPGYLEAIARALDTTAEALTPKIGQTFGNTEPFPEVQMEAASGGKAWLRINKHVSMDTALRVLQILREDNGNEKNSRPPEPVLVSLFGGQAG